MSHSNAGALLALWNSISSPGLALEYETWHTFEHVPERVGLPGFIEARRYRSLQDPTQYYTWYRVATLEAFSTPEYLGVVSHPTPWSARMRRELRDFYRMPCVTGGICGNSSASRLATLRLRSTAPDFADRLNARLKQMVQEGALVRTQWALAVPSDDFPVPNVEANATVQGQDFVVMLEHLDGQALRNGTETLLQFPSALAASPVQPAYFELLTLVRQDELTGPLDERQPRRTDLMDTFNSKETS